MVFSRYRIDRHGMIWRRAAAIGKVSWETGKRLVRCWARRPIGRGAPGELATITGRRASERAAVCPAAPTRSAAATVTRTWRPRSTTCAGRGQPSSWADPSAPPATWTSPCWCACTWRLWAWSPTGDCSSPGCTWSRSRSRPGRRSRARPPP